MLLCLEQNFIVKEKLLCDNLIAEKKDPFQTIKMPLEAPTDGRKSKQSKEGGQIFLKNIASKSSFFVSYKQTISH